VKVAVIGAGWAGCAAAVEATRCGHQVSLFEATRIAGGRARRFDASYAGHEWTLDNGQHILIGAYSETLKLMADVGVDVNASLLRLPLTMQFPDGNGVAFPHWPAPLDALAGIVTARGWSWQDKWALLKVSSGWQIRRFQCAAHETVAGLCRELTPRVMATLIEPLCVSALNTPPGRSSGQVFLRVMQDALFAGTGASNLLLPLRDLGALLPDPALHWLQKNGAAVHLGARVQQIEAQTAGGWTLQGAGLTGIGFEPAALFDRVILASPPAEARRLAQGSSLPWLDAAASLQYEAITTVYAMAPGVRLGQPMLALHASASHPAQFVFDRGQLNGPAGLLAFVVSASIGDGASLSRQVLAQAAAQLEQHGIDHIEVIKTIVEKRATFACLPGLRRPGAQVAPGLLACGDYVDGPYPATLEGAVRSGLAAAHLLHTS
jgi:squalene-associated FAD-dependent desaturase